MKRDLILFGAALALLLTAGPSSIGRVALWAGFPRAAEPLLTDPAAKGVALFRSGAFQEADAAFTAAGRGQTFNRALSLAAIGRYELSVAYFDAVLFSNPNDAEARRLRDIVAARVEVNIGKGVDGGRLPARSKFKRKTPPEKIDRLGLPDPEIVKPVEARSVVADEAWLSTLGDDPGEFLRLKLKAEYEYRAGLGLIRPREANPW